MVRGLRAAMWATAILACAGSARADAVSDFYKDKTVTVVVPAGLGGSIGL